LITKQWRELTEDQMIKVLEVVINKGLSISKYFFNFFFFLIISADATLRLLK